jgi:hypothetical protein
VINVSSRKQGCSLIGQEIPVSGCGFCKQAESCSWNGQGRESTVKCTVSLLLSLRNGSEHQDILSLIKCNKSTVKKVKYVLEIRFLPNVIFGFDFLNSQHWKREEASTR